MQLTFYGVRGSVPSPGPDFVQYGGNTACTHIHLSDGTDIILDAGTGIIGLGQKLVEKQSDIHILLTHNHWDHIQGFPFFAPIYQTNRNIFITPGKTNQGQHDAILKQMSGSYFPVNYQSLQANIKVIPQAEQCDRWQLGSAVISRLNLNHPGGGSAYLIDADGAKVAYITDNELYPPYQKSSDFLDWAKFAQGVDLLVHDAQYMQTDMPKKSGWGHSIAEEAVKLAMACRAKQLALYSHDNTRTDKELEEIEQHCQEYVRAVDADLTLFAAAEGMQLTF